MKQHALALLLTLSTSVPLFAAEGWLTDFAAAKEQAEAGNKALLIDFTGSDWCGWCIRLREEVFDHAPFKEGVAEDFILVELDYPRDTSKMSEATIAQNEKLKNEYGIRGYPTIYVTDAQGRPFARTGYREGGPEPYVAHLKTLLAQRDDRDAALKTAAESEGAEKAKALETVLGAVPEESIGTFYAEELAALKELSPESELVHALVAAQAAEAREKEFRELFAVEDFAKVVARVDEIAAEEKPEGEDLQALLAFKVNAHMAQEQIDEAIAVLDAIHAVDPGDPLRSELPAVQGPAPQAQGRRGRRGRGKGGGTARGEIRGVPPNGGRHARHHRGEEARWGGERHAKRDGSRAFRTE